MPAPFSVDLRQRIITAYQAKEGSQRQLAERFKVSFSFVRDLTRRYRQTGSVEPKPHGGGAVAKLGSAQLPIVEALVEAQPDAILEEFMRTLCSKEWSECQSLHDATRHRGLRLERQKKTLVAAEQDTQRVQDLRFAHRLWSFTVDPRNLVFIDETGMHLGFTRLTGRAPKGERLYDTETPGNPGQNISLIGADESRWLDCSLQRPRQCQYRHFLVLRPGDSDSSTVGGSHCLDG